MKEKNKIWRRKEKMEWMEDEEKGYCVSERNEGGWREELFFKSAS